MHYSGTKLVKKSHILKFINDFFLLLSGNELSLQETEKGHQDVEVSGDGRFTVSARRDCGRHPAPEACRDSNRPDVSMLFRIKYNAVRQTIHHKLQEHTDGYAELFGQAQLFHRTQR